jgi:hypothetical protein
MVAVHVLWLPDVPQLCTSSTEAYVSTYLPGLIGQILYMFGSRLEVDRKDQPVHMSHRLTFHFRPVNIESTVESLPHPADAEALCNGYLHAASSGCIVTRTTLKVNWRKPNCLT